MVFLLSDNIQVVARSLHPTYPLFLILHFDFERLIDPMGIVGMEKYDGFRKKRKDGEQNKDRNQYWGFEFAHKKAYSTDKKIMSNDRIGFAASF
jgi:hypothetical protein